MKYIRTKDGNIYDTLNCVGKYYVIKQADTIEELCDEFVAIGYGVKGKPAVVIGNNGFYAIKTMLSNYEVYGAIWTELGLKYVAKMNDKGELELL